MRKTKLIQPVAIAIIKKGNEYLLTKRSKLDAEDNVDFLDKWQLPGGGMEFGEKPEQTLHREVKEELGIEVINKSLSPLIFTEVRGRWQGLFFCYKCELKDSQAIVLNEESSEYRWFTREEVKNIDTLPGVYEVIIETEKLI